MTAFATDSASAAGLSRRGEIVRLSGVSKRYGRSQALSSIDFHLLAGEVVGLVGPNGAGKSTLLKLLAGSARPTSGTGEVVGRPLAPSATFSQPAHVGVVLERPPFIESMSGLDNLRALAEIRGVLDLADLRDACRLVGLDPEDRRPVRAYSQGMRQRLAYAQAVMEHPPLVLLDEPTNGLDPRGIADLRVWVAREAARGAGVVLASHLLSEVEAVCDRVVVLDGGRVVGEVRPVRGSLEPAYLSLVATSS